MGKHLSDEEIISAILSTGSARAAAAALKIQPSTVYTRAKKRDFQALYNQKKQEIVEGASLQLQHELAEAIRTISDIMHDSGNPAQLRLSAADSIIRHAEKLPLNVESEADRKLDEYFDDLLGDTKERIDETDE